MMSKSDERGRIFYIIILFVSIFLFSACAPVGEPLPQISKELRTQYLNANNLFAFKLYKELRVAQKENLFFSPYSIYTAMVMTYVGAKGNTATEIEKMLSLTLTGEDLHKANGWFLTDLNNRGQAGYYELAIANKLWGQAGYTFLPDFLATLKKYYGAGLEEVDFSKAPDVSRKKINDWVENKTKQRIKDLLPAGSIDSATRLVLANAIYFKADWLYQFKKDDTVSNDFAVSAKKNVKVEMMYQKVKINWANLADLKILALPYKNKELSMILLLPNKKDGLIDLESKLSLANLDKWTAQMHEEEVRIYLPKFEMTQKNPLRVHFQKMGMKQAFSTTADFSNIDGTKELYISEVFHKAFIKVDEEGTEAAAATAVVFEKNSISPDTIFRANHPFIFFIRDNKTQNILFIGSIKDPTQKN